MHDKKKFPNHKSRLTNYTPTVTEKRRQKAKVCVWRAEAGSRGSLGLIAALMGVVRAKMRAGVHLTVICNKIRWLLMTPSGSVMAGIKALIPARTSAAHGSTQAKPATDGLTTGLHGGHPGSRWGSCTSLNSEPRRGKSRAGRQMWDLSKHRGETPLGKEMSALKEGFWDSGVERRDGSASVCDLYADSIGYELKRVPFWPLESLKFTATSNNI